MISIFETYQQLNEDFQSKYLRMIAQDVSLLNINFKKFAEKTQLYYIAWDKIKDEDVEKYDTGDIKSKDMMLKLYRAVKSGKDSYAVGQNKRITLNSHWIVLVGYANDRLQFVFNSESPNHIFAISRNSIQSIYKPRECEDYIRSCDTVYLISIDKRSAKELFNDRIRSKSGMVPDLDDRDRAVKAVDKSLGVLGKDAGGLNIHTYYMNAGGDFYKYCSNVAREARERYEKIVANNKFKRTADTKEIDDLVKETMDTYFSFVQESMKAAVTNKKVSEYRLQDLSRLVMGNVKSSKHSEYGWIEGGLLNTYSKYCEKNIELSHGGGSYAASYLKDRNVYADRIKTISKTINDKIESLKKDWEM